MRQPDPRQGLGALALIVVLLSIAAPATTADTRGAAPTVLYRLHGPSAFLSGCIEGPCLCPIRWTYMGGTFGMTPSGPADGFQTYAVSNIEWFTHANGEVWNQVTGQGTYFLDDEMQRIVLDLSVDGADPLTVDSGVVPRGVAFPAIDIGALTDGFCFQEGVDIEAAPSAHAIDVSMLQPGMVAWSVAPGATAYDVVAGDLLQLRASGGDFTLATRECLGNDLVGTAVNGVGPVAPGQAIWFAVRGLPQPGFDSAGPAQVGLRDWEIEASTASCP